MSFDIEPIFWLDYRGRVTCLAGEVNTGKTARLLEILKRALAAGEEPLVLDLAPEKIKNVGGKLGVEGLDGVTYLTGDIAAPRLSGADQAEVWALARQNRDRIDEMLAQARTLAGRALFVNDVSLYLQAGEAENLLEFTRNFPTVVLNGYYGAILAGGDLGVREREQMERLFAACDRVIHL